MITSKLTGNTRHRVQKTLFGYYLVLQVEVHASGYTHEYNGGMVDSIDVDKIYWRDATAQDMKEIK